MCMTDKVKKRKGMEKYKRIEMIGRGTFGDVLLVQRLSDGKVSPHPIIKG